MIRTETLTLRKKLHKNPELSGFEFETANTIRKFIKKHHATEIYENVGGTGLLAVYKYPKKGPSITIRCELDALPIQEENASKHCSVHKGVSHKCGHDGHMAIVSGLLFWIKEQKFNSGEIILLFQPAEENGKGAQRVVNDPKFKNLKTDYVFALHNIPKEPLHQIIVLKKGFSAEVQSCIIKVKGKKCHASEPENGINPALGVSSLIKAISDLEVTNPTEDNFALLTPVHIVMGQKAYGISPENAELHYTIRAWSTEKMNALKEKLQELVSVICKKYTIDFYIEWLEYFPAAINHIEANKWVSNAAKDNHFSLTERPFPFKFGEDFGWFSKHYKTAMFGLGAGIETPALHHANYDFPDAIIETGMRMFQSILLSILQQK